MAEGNKVEEVIAGVGGAAAAAAAAAASIGASAALTIGAAGGAALVPVTLGPAARFFVGRAARRWAALLREYVAGTSADPAVVEAQLHAQADKPVVQELVVEAARAVADALTDSAVPAMARLLREYAPQERSVDSFFRGVRRVLSDVDEDELRSLRDLLVALNELPFKAAPFTVEVFYGNGAQGIRLYGVGHALAADPGSDGPVKKAHETAPSEQLVVAAEFEHLPRLFNLLKTNDLATESMGRWGVAGTMLMLISAAHLKRLVALVS
jgi:hypothetical protein